MLLNNKLTYAEISEIFDSIYGSKFNSLFDEPKPTKSIKQPKPQPNYFFKKYSDSYVILLDALGYSKDDISIDYDSDDHAIIVSGTLNEDIAEKLKPLTTVIKEFEKGFLIEVPIDVDKIDAESFNGVIVITIPFKEKTERKTIAIK